MRQFNAIVMSLVVLFTSCGSSDTSPKELDTSPKEIEVLFRDRTEKNAVEEEFTVSLNDDIAQSAKFEALTVFPLISKLEVGDSISFEFFGGLEGVLRVKYLSFSEKSRIVVEVYDKSISILENESFKLNEGAVKRRFIDKEAGFKVSLREALRQLKDKSSERIAASNANIPDSNESIKKFNEKFSRVLPSLASYIREIEDFVSNFPEFSPQGEALLALMRSLDSSTGLASVANDTSTLNRHIGAMNDSLPLVEDAEFRLFSAIENRLKK